MTEQRAESKKIYFMGIGGTGMAPTAGLALAAGHEVVGSDKELYPPMSDLIAELGIKVFKGYDPTNIDSANPDLVVVANVLSADHPEIQALVERKIPFTSFPGLLHDLFLAERTSIVVAGTHGKTTTTAMLSYLLKALHQKPSYLIGGLPKDLPRSFALDDSPLFVIEGDEYDTAYFDKGPKFLHYAPNYLIVNNIEFDHADIYDDIEQIKSRFMDVMSLVADKSHIIANGDDPNILDCLNRLGIAGSVRLTSAAPHSPANATIASFKSGKNGSKIQIDTDTWGVINITSPLTGIYNAMNFAQAINCLEAIYINGDLKGVVSGHDIGAALSEFQGVKRRLDRLAEVDGISIYEDFAHHPTAVHQVIKNFRESQPDRRLIVAFEPRNATSRRNVFQKQYEQALSQADAAYIGPCPYDGRIQLDQKMDTQDLAKRIGAHAKAFDSNEALQSDLLKETREGDILLFMSCGSFGGIQYNMAPLLEHRNHREPSS